MYTTIIHPIRKALQLSCNEYCVLDTIYALSNNSDFGGWCYKSKQNIADDLDLSRRTVIDIINALEAKGYVIRNEKGNFLKPSNDIRALFSEKSNWAIGVKNEEIKLLSLKFNSGCAESSPSVKCAETAQEGVQKVHGGCAESSHYIDNNNTLDNYNNPPTPFEGGEGEKEDDEYSINLSGLIKQYPNYCMKYCGRHVPSNLIDRKKVDRKFRQLFNSGIDAAKILGVIQNIGADAWERKNNFPSLPLNKLLTLDTISRYRPSKPTIGKYEDNELPY